MPKGTQICFHKGGFKPRPCTFFCIFTLLLSTSWANPFLLENRLLSPGKSLYLFQLPADTNSSLARISLTCTEFRFFEKQNSLSQASSSQQGCTTNLQMHLPGKLLFSQSWQQESFRAKYSRDSSARASYASPTFRQNTRVEWRPFFSSEPAPLWFSFGNGSGAPAARSFAFGGNLPLPASISLQIWNRIRNEGAKISFYTVELGKNEAVEGSSDQLRAELGIELRHKSKTSRSSLRATLFRISPLRPDSGYWFPDSGYAFSLKLSRNTQENSRQKRQFSLSWEQSNIRSQGLRVQGENGLKRFHYSDWQSRKGEFFWREKFDMAHWSFSTGLDLSLLESNFKPSKNAVEDREEFLAFNRIYPPNLSDILGGSWYRESLDAQGVFRLYSIQMPLGLRYEHNDFSLKLQLPLALHSTKLQLDFESRSSGLASAVENNISRSSQAEGWLLTSSATITAKKQWKHFNLQTRLGHILPLWNKINIYETVRNENPPTSGDPATLTTPKKSKYPFWNNGFLAEFRVEIFL